MPSAYKTGPSEEDVSCPRTDASPAPEGVLPKGSPPSSDGATHPSNRETPFDESSDALAHWRNWGVRWETGFPHEGMRLQSGPCNGTTLLAHRRAPCCEARTFPLGRDDVHPTRRRVSRPGMRVSPTDAPAPPTVAPPLDAPRIPIAPPPMAPPSRSSASSYRALAFPASRWIPGSPAG